MKFFRRFARLVAALSGGILAIGLVNVSSKNIDSDGNALETTCDAVTNKNQQEARRQAVGTLTPDDLPGPVLFRNFTHIRRLTVSTFFRCWKEADEEDRPITTSIGFQ